MKPDVDPPAPGSLSPVSPTGRALEYSKLELGQLGYTEQEFFVGGAARSFRPTDQGAETSGVSDFCTRVLLRAPLGRAFSGTLVFEWFNASAGADLGLIWIYTHNQLIRAGHAWVGVSAEAGSIGGAAGAADRGLRRFDPDRYARLAHPGNRFCSEVFAASCSTVLANAVDLFGADPICVLACGFSQAAHRLVTYVNHLDRTQQIFDGFLLHGRPATGAPLEADFGDWHTDPDVTLLADPVRAPTIVVQTESELLSLGFHRSRQPDQEWLRTWEVTGSAHVDSYMRFGAHRDDGARPFDELARVFGPAGRRRLQANSAPQRHYVLNAALTALEAWSIHGISPTPSLPIDLTDTQPPRLILEESGIARGGLRTPWVDVPLTVSSGAGSSTEIPAGLVGSSRWIEPGAARWTNGGRATIRDFLAAFEAAAEACVAARHLSAADLPEILGVAAELHRLWTNALRG